MHSRVPDLVSPDFYIASFLLLCNKHGLVGWPTDPDLDCGPDLLFSCFHICFRFSMYIHVESILWGKTVWWWRCHCGTANGATVASQGRQHPPPRLPLWDWQCPSPSIAVVIVIVAWSLLFTLPLGIIIAIFAIVPVVAIVAVTLVAPVAVALAAIVVALAVVTTTVLAVAAASVGT